MRENFKTENEVFVYDFSTMNLRSALACRTLFVFHEKMMSKISPVPSEIQLALERNLQLKAFAALLCRANGDSVDAEDVGKLRAADFHRLEYCRRDFILNINNSPSEKSAGNHSHCRQISPKELPLSSVSESNAELPNNTPESRSKNISRANIIDLHGHSEGNSELRFGSAMSYRPMQYKTQQETRDSLPYDKRAHKRRKRGISL